MFVMDDKSKLIEKYTARWVEAHLVDFVFGLSHQHNWFCGGLCIDVVEVL